MTRRNALLYCQFVLLFLVFNSRLVQGHAGQYTRRRGGPPFVASETKTALPGIPAKIEQVWVDASTNHRAVFANLAPGRYRFPMQATRTGVWTITGDVFSFWISPAVYATSNLGVMCILALIAGCAFMYWFCSQQRRGTFKVVAEERLRITRDVHDTLLQSFLGVVYNLDVASRNFDKSPELSRQRLDLALTQADRALLEARQMLVNLRFHPLEEAPFPVALSRAVRQLVESTAIRSNVRIDRRSEGLPYHVQVNLYIISREAVTNAVNHGQPNCISVRLECSADEFVVTVEDDGIGFDLREVKHKPDHFGLIAVQERAKNINASIKVTTGLGLGTRVQVRGRLHAASSERYARRETGNLSS